MACFTCQLFKKQMADVRHSSRLGSEYFPTLLPNYVLDLLSLIHPLLFSYPTFSPSTQNSQPFFVYLLTLPFPCLCFVWFMAWFSELKVATISHWCFSILHTYREKDQAMVSQGKGLWGNWVVFSFSYHWKGSDCFIGNKVLRIIKRCWGCKENPCSVGYQLGQLLSHLWLDLLPLCKGVSGSQRECEMELNFLKELWAHCISQILESLLNVVFSGQPEWPVVTFNSEIQKWWFSLSLYE